MILVDTSIWIEFFRANGSIMPIVTEQLSHQRILGVECIFGELLQGAKNLQERNIILEYWANLPKRNEEGLWVEAGKLSSSQKYYAKGIGLIDTFLIVFSKKYKTKIWSLDKKLLSVLDFSEQYYIDI